MMFIAVTRYIAVAYPHRFKIWLKNGKCFMAMLFIWLLSIFLCILIVQLMGKLELIVHYGVCMLTFRPTGVVGQDAMNITVLVILLVCPIACSTLIYWKIFVIVHRSKKTVRHLLIGIGKTATASYQKTKKREYRLTITFYIMFITYLVSYLPYFLVHILRLLSVSPSNFPWTFATTAITIINSVINPFVYLYRNFHNKVPIRSQDSQNTRIIHVRSNRNLFQP